MSAIDAFLSATAEIHRLQLVTRNVSNFHTLKTSLNPWVLVFALERRTGLPSTSDASRSPALVQRGAIEILTVQPHGPDLRRVPNVGEWVSVEQYQVGAFPRSDGSLIGAAAQKQGRIHRGRLQSSQLSQARL